MKDAVFIRGNKRLNARLRKEQYIISGSDGSNFLVCLDKNGVLRYCERAGKSQQERTQE